MIIQQVIPEYRKDFFSLLKDALSKEDVELDLIYGKMSSSYKSGNSYHEISWGKLVPSRSLKIGKMLLCWQPVTKYVRNKDLVIVEQANRLIINYYLIIGKYFWKNKLGFWGHGRNLQKKYNSWTNKFGLLYLKRCDWWWGYTQGVKEYLSRNGYPLNKITIVQNAIDTQSLRTKISNIDNKEILNLKNDLSITGNKIGIFCGAMYTEKRIDFILQTCAIIKSQIPEFEMIFIGSGQDSNKVVQACKINKWIHFLGSRTGDDRIKYFKMATIQLMPGAVGLAILDSFALETPIITTDNRSHGPEIEYLENNINGIMTNDNLSDYSATIIQILKTNKYLDLVKGCIISSDKYTVQNMVENFKSGILECLTSKT
ncbi:MAG: glycosyltransferase [Ferruginibacter sp.]